MFVMIAAATALIIFRPNTNEIHSDTDEKSLTQKQRLRKSIKGTVFLLFSAIYFIVSFLTGAWYITWIIFLIAASASKLITACIDLYHETKSLK